MRGLLGRSSLVSQARPIGGKTLRPFTGGEPGLFVIPQSFAALISHYPVLCERPSLVTPTWTPLSHCWFADCRKIFHGLSKQRDRRTTPVPSIPSLAAHPAASRTAGVAAGRAANRGTATGRTATGRRTTVAAGPAAAPQRREHRLTVTPAVAHGTTTRRQKHPGHRQDGEKMAQTHSELLHS